MAVSDSSDQDHRPGGRFAGRRRIRLAAAVAVVVMTATAIVGAGGGTAAAAALPEAQSVGRFLDGSAGGNPIERIADLKDARATAPGDQSQQNPLDVTLLGQLNLPLTGALQFPTDPSVDAGVVNQVAKAETNGLSYGAAGAVADDGGISAGDDNGDEFPIVATTDLSGDALGTMPGLPGLPGAGDASALGGVTANIGAVSANARTASGGEVTPAPQYNIAGLNLVLASPALGDVLSRLGNVLKPPDLSVIDNLPVLPTACTFQAQVLSDLDLDNGAIKISPTSGSITITLSKLLSELNLDINQLPANTDLVAYLLDYITDPDQLAKGLQNAINDLVTPLQTSFADCLTALGAGDVKDLFTSGQGALNALVDSITGPLADATAGSNPLKPLAAGLKNVIDIGVNVESGPGIQKEQSDEDLRFETGLNKTPDQDTPVVQGQTLIRALEIDLLRVDPDSLGGLPPVKFAKLAAPNSTGVTLALANAAVGPSTAREVAAPTTTTTAKPNVLSANIPTGVPAGAAGHPGSPVLPLVLLLLALTLAGGGYVSYRMRGKFGR